MWLVSAIRHEDRLYYLTDKELLEERRLEGVLPQHHWLTRKAVRHAFGIPELKGEGLTCWEFYKPDLLPEELKRPFVSYASFMKVWGRTWHELVSKCQLRALILGAPDPWHEEAWHELLRRTHIECHLMWIMQDAADANIQLRAWRTLKERAITLRDVYYLARDLRVHEPIRREAETLYTSWSA